MFPFTAFCGFNFLSPRIFRGSPKKHAAFGCRGFPSPGVPRHPGVSPSQVREELSEAESMGWQPQNARAPLGGKTDVGRAQGFAVRPLGRTVSRAWFCGLRWV